MLVLMSAVLLCINSTLYNDPCLEMVPYLPYQTYGLQNSSRQCLKGRWIQQIKFQTVRIQKLFVLILLSEQSTVESRSVLLPGQLEECAHCPGPKLVCGEHTTAIDWLVELCSVRTFCEALCSNCQWLADSVDRKPFSLSPCGTSFVILPPHYHLVARDWQQT